MLRKWSMLLTCLAGLMGAAGVAAGAAAAHTTGGGTLETASHYLLVHAAAIAALSLNHRASKIFLASASLLTLGAALFSGDLALRALAGVKLFAMAAPAGGIILIAGWLTLALASLIHLVSKPPQG